jgi:NADPH-dependent glutamate synthase beta subunit-like oxidoreductase
MVGKNDYVSGSRKMKDHKKVAIIGNGPAGNQTAAHALKDIF